MSRRRDFWRRARGHPSFVVGGALSALLAVAAIVSLFWQPWPPAEIDIPNKLQPPSAAHWLGTDENGCDVLSQLLYGARLAVLLSVITVLLCLVVGASIGVVAGYFGGLVDEVIMRLVDVLLAFPGILLNLAIIAIVPNASMGVFLRVCARPTHVGRRRRSWLVLRWWRAANDGAATPAPNWPCV